MENYSYSPEFSISNTQSLASKEEVPVQLESEGEESEEGSDRKDESVVEYNIYEDMGKYEKDLAKVFQNPRFVSDQVMNRKEMKKKQGVLHTGAKITNLSNAVPTIRLADLKSEMKNRLPTHLRNTISKEIKELRITNEEYKAYENRAMKLNEKGYSHSEIDLVEFVLEQRTKETGTDKKFQ
ncbi:unnamed protein product [Moneuplotes crassus]|uniref:Uncharacterized protein n=2 Tax=Euplotes crassus TaxID=5936 RepID=A0AAD2D6W4_EUPCR|nr:unnamed protein product [Moneuplotes crassus]